MTEKLYEDGEIKILLEGKRVIIMPTEIKSAKELSEQTFAKIGSASTLCSAILFETLGAQGTNIVMHDDKQFAAHIIPRIEGDGINLLWKPKNMEEAIIKEMKGKIADALFETPKVEVSVEEKKIVLSDTTEEAKEEPVEETPAEEVKEEIEQEITPPEESKEEKKEEKKPINYILRSLKRKP